MRYAFFDQHGRVASAHNDATRADAPVGAVALSPAEFDDRFNLRLAEGALVYDPPTAPQSTQQDVVAALTRAVQTNLDTVARSYGYDNALTACTYADEPSVPRFQRECAAIRAWRSMVWAACHAVMEDVQAGNRPVPTASELIAELPVLLITSPS